MTIAERKLLAALTLAAVLVPLVLSAVLDWSAWSWLLCTALLLGILGLVVRNILRRLQREQLRDLHASEFIEAESQSVEVDESEARQTLIIDVALPSAAAEYNFCFSATVYWRPAMGSTVWHADLRCLATDALIGRAQAITVVEQPSRVDVVQHRLAAVLGVAQRDVSNNVEAWAEQVTLTLSEADQLRLRKHSDVRKDRDIWEHERDHERSKREYLGNDVLKSTGSAVVWWLVQKDNDIEGAVRLIGALAQLSAAANETEIPELFRHLVPVSALSGQPSSESWDSDQQFSNGRPGRNGLDALMDVPLEIDVDQRPLFARRFARLVEIAGKAEEALEIRRRFDTAVAEEKPMDIPVSDEELPDRHTPEDQPPHKEPPENSPT